MFRYPAPQQPATAGYAIAGDRFAMLLPPGIPDSLIAGLWDAAASERALLEDVLGVLVAAGIHALPDFAVVEFSDDSPDRARVAVRGAITVESADGIVEGRGVRTWTETSLDAITGLRIRRADGSPHAGILPLGLGVVRADELAWGRPLEAAPALVKASPAATPPPPAPSPTTDARVAPAVASPVVSAAVGSLDESDVLETLSIDRSLFARPLEDDDIELPAFLTDETGDIEIPDDRTLLGGLRAAPKAQARYALVVTPERALPLDRPIVLGRGPRPARHPGARIEVVPSPAKEISGAHLEVRLDGDQLLARDLDSTNGTIVRPAGGEPLLLRGGASLRVPLDTAFDLGDGVMAVFVTAP